jgi:hypothetical protein
MATQALGIYLNDHSAGAHGALALLQHLEAQYADTEHARFAAMLRVEVEADERQLQEIIERLQIRGGGPRKFASWLTERAAQLKLAVDDPSEGTLRLLESLEALVLGIHGKLALWRSLDRIASDMPELQGLDFTRLARRATDQRERVEQHRLSVVRTALVGTPATTV